MVAGITADTEKTAVFDLDGIKIICISKRQQCRSSDFITAFGLDASSFNSVLKNLEVILERGSTICFQMTK